MTMTKFAKFDRTNLKSLRAELAAVLEKYGVSSNLELAVGNMKFTEAEVEIKVTAKVIGAKTRSDNILETMIKLKGLKLKNAKGDELVGYNTRAHKMPFIYLKASDGKRYKCAEDMAKFMFAA
jgi:uncharacterized protein YejL (UPF0352 family)